MRMNSDEYFNPYNRHDTGVYCVYRKSDNRYLGMITNCDDAVKAERIARYRYGSDVCVDLVEE